MKRIITLGATFLMLIFVLCSCSMHNNSDTASDNNETAFNINDFKIVLEKTNYQAGTDEIDYSVENNSVDKSVATGEECYLERNTDGEWKRIKTNVLFYGTGRLITPNESADFKIEFSDSPLEKGKYRIRKNAIICDHTVNNDGNISNKVLSDTAKLIAEFTVEQ